MEVSTSDLLTRLKREVRIQVLDDLIRHLQTLRASASVPEGPTLGGMNLTDAAESILKEQGSRGTREIAETLLARGIKTNSKNFVATVYASLKVDKRFERDGSNWTLAKKRR